MADLVRAAVLVAPGQLELSQYPYPSNLEPGAVLIRIEASGICGTDKHTFRGETAQYAGTDHARTTPFPIIQGHENVGEIVEIGPGGAASFDGGPLAVGDRVVPAPNRACGHCRFCRGDFPYYMCRHLENYGNSLSSAEPPHLLGGWAEYLYLRPRTPIFRVPEGLPTEVAVLTEVFAVTHSLDLATRIPRPGGFGEGDSVAVIGVGPVGLVHVARAALMGAGRVIAVDKFEARLEIACAMGATDSVVVGTDSDDVAETIRELTGGEGADLVVDATGHPTSFATAIGALRDGGTLLEVGAFVDLGPVPFNPADLLGRNLTLVGVAGEDARGYDSILRMLAEHHEQVPFHRAVTHTYPLAHASEAMETALAAGDAMKVMITPD